MAECFFSSFNNVNLDHHKLLLQSTWNLPCVLGQSSRYTRRDQALLFLDHFHSRTHYLCPQVLHHLNEVGDNLCLKFSRRKHDLSRASLSEETDS